MSSLWMVDVKGQSGHASEEDMKTAIEGLDFSKFIEAEGTLASNIQQFIKDEGFNITDRGGGIEAWHIGVPFNDLQEAAKYIDTITKKFMLAMAKGFIRIQLMSWSQSDWYKLWEGQHGKKTV